jgi:hypothetical protein
MKVSKLYTYFDPEDAATIIDFLGHLQEVLWDAYGSDIMLTHFRAESEVRQQQHQQMAVDFDDGDIPF